MSVEAPAYDIQPPLKSQQVPRTHLLIHAEFLLHKQRGLGQHHRYVCVFRVLSVLNDEVWDVYVTCVYRCSRSGSWCDSQMALFKGRLTHGCNCMQVKNDFWTCLQQSGEKSKKNSTFLLTLIPTTECACAGPTKKYMWNSSLNIYMWSITCVHWIHHMRLFHIWYLHVKLLFSHDDFLHFT